MIVVTDMDDVLVDLLPAWLQILNDRYSKHVKVEDVTEWDMRCVYPDLTDKELYGVLNEDSLWDIVQPKRDAVEFLKAIKDAGHKVLVCTATHYKNIEKKLTRCLLKHFPWLTYKDIIMCHHKRLIKCDVIIDDNVDNLRGSDGVRILYSCSHNKHIPEIDYHFRVSSMEEVYSIINQLERVDKNA